MEQEQMEEIYKMISMKKLMIMFMIQDNTKYPMEFEMNG